MSKKGKENGKAKGKAKGKPKGKGNGKGNVEGSSEGIGLLVIVNENEVLKPNLRGLSDIEEYDSDELPHKYDSDNGEIIKDAFVTFKLPKKWKTINGK